MITFAPYYSFSIFVTCKGIRSISVDLKPHFVNTMHVVSVLYLIDSTSCMEGSYVMLDFYPIRLLFRQGIFIYNESSEKQA